MKRKAISYSQDVTMTNTVLDGIRFVRTVFPAGSSFSYFYMQDTPYNLTMSTHVQSEGVMAGLGLTVPAEWCNRDESFVIPYGPFTLVAQTAAVRWCCIGLADNDPTDFVSVVRVASGQTLSLAAGDNVLILKGRLSTAAGVLSEGRHIKCTNATNITCTQSAIAFKWRTEDVEARYAVSPLSKAKAEKWALMKSMRTIRDNGGFTYLGKLYDSDAAAQVNISGAAQAASLNPGFTIDWVTADNSIQTLDDTQVIGLGLALAAHRSANHATSTALRNAIEACTTVEAVNAITWA